MISKFKSLKNHQGFMKYFKNTSWLLFGQIFKMIIGFFVIITLTRYLGPEKFGLLSYAQSYVGIFVAFATLGIDVILVRELTKNKGNSNKLIGTAFFSKVFISIIAIFIIFILNMFMTDKEAVLLTNIIAFILLFQSINTIDTFFQANVISKHSVLANTIAFMFSSLMKIILIYLEADLIYFAYVLLLDSIFIAIGYIYVYIKQKQSLLKWSFDKEIALYFLKNGWPLMLVALAAFVYTRTDQVMIKHLIDNEAVGNYAAAVKISELFYFIPLLITQSIFPKIIEMKSKSEKEYFALLEKLYKILVWSVIPISISLFIFSDLIVSILYGSQYVQASSILSILAFAIIFNAIGTVTTKVLYAEHYERKYLYRSLLGVVVNIGLNFYFISIYGIQGAAISTLITLFIIYYIYDILDKDLHKFYYLKLICYIPSK
ncbi:MAG: Putative polysaccharide biosynthesis protein [uncultured Sulfurovum sp.]|uniref:Polysaccharide biosynthesis protein n=1 Tax=uncultured Sulfurovum sp. TaxID=269237 RepID=A0A6S6TLK4_9BACT|nr:MAG: Putative polysaccharide biosynthesis protein [uncultured Sulfurovum sp.]